MNTRGLTELVILTVGFQKGVLDRELFTLLVVMAVFTTVITEPLLRLIYPDRLIARDIATAERAAMAAPPAYRVLVAVDDVARVEPLADVSAALVRGHHPAEIVLSHLRVVDQSTQTLEISSGLTAELAEIAESLEVLNRVAGTLQASNVDCVVLERASRNVSADLPAQITAVQADVVLFDTRVGAGSWHAVARAVVEQGSARLLVADFVPAIAVENTCVCVLASDRSDAAVLDVGLRLATGFSAVLLLVDGLDSRRGLKRAESFAGRLRRGGVTVDIGRLEDHSRSRVRFAIAALPEALLADGRSIGAAARPHAELTVLVHPRPDEEDELDRVLQELHDTAALDRSR
jgi:hypothetical protein